MSLIPMRGAGKKYRHCLLARSTAWFNFTKLEPEQLSDSSRTAGFQWSFQKFPWFVTSVIRRSSYFSLPLALKNLSEQAGSVHIIPSKLPRLSSSPLPHMPLLLYHSPTNAGLSVVRGGQHQSAFTASSLQLMLALWEEMERDGERQRDRMNGPLI